ncbi:YMGG-like glycine zipper-containing protein [Bryobacter aggregatus]|uniref:YMGG-like glycine zipper-containing protein n=1 Tax=Bryobacter aggregatus TaxID=360054 RepID=UPI00068EFC4C|nr:YMGG-like glycine zipper-containing protein [Bryobacter aggregatus]
MKSVLMMICLGVAAFGQRIPSATAIQVRINDTIDSSKAEEGQNFTASVAEDVRVNGRVLVTRGSAATVRLVNLDKSGKFKGSTQLGVVLTELRVGNRTIPVESGEVTRVSGSQGKNTAVKTGVGAGLGAVIGAIAGGGKGAAIGAGAGGAAGAGSQIFTKGQKVKIPSESVLTFTLLRDARV